MFLDALLERVLFESKHFQAVKSSAERLLGRVTNSHVQRSLQEVAHDVKLSNLYAQHVYYVILHMGRPLYSDIVSEQELLLWKRWYDVLQKVRSHLDNDELGSVIALIRAGEEETLWDVFWKRVWFLIEGESDHMMKEIKVMEQLPRRFEIHKELCEAMAKKHLNPNASSDAHHIYAGVAFQFGVYLPDPHVALISSGLNRLKADIPLPPTSPVDSDVYASDERFMEHVRDQLRMDETQIELKEAIQKSGKRKTMSRAEALALDARRKAEAPHLLQTHPQLVAEGHLSSAIQHLDAAQRIETGLSSVPHSAYPGHSTIAQFPEDVYNAQRVALQYRGKADEHLEHALELDPTVHPFYHKLRLDNRATIREQYQHHLRPRLF